MLLMVPPYKEMQCWYWGALLPFLKLYVKNKKSLKDPDYDCIIFRGLVAW